MAKENENLYKYEMDTHFRTLELQINLFIIYHIYYEALWNIEPENFNDHSSY